MWLSHIGKQINKISWNTMIAVCINKLHGYTKGPLSLIAESNPLGFAHLHSQIGPENLATFFTNVIQNDNQ